jgi:hypothetical protein
MAGEMGWSVVAAWANAFGSTDLNSLGSGSNKMSTLTDPQYQNTGSGLFIQFEAFMGGSMTTTAGAALIVSAVPRMSDGTNWPTDLTGGNGVPIGNYPTAALQFYVGAANPHRQVSDIVPLPPGYYRFNALNRLGASMPSSGNMIRFQILTQAVS